MFLPAYTRTQLDLFSWGPKSLAAPLNMTSSKSLAWSMTETCGQAIDGRYSRFSLKFHWDQEEVEIEVANHT